MNKVDVFNQGKSPINSISVIEKGRKSDHYSVDPAESRKLVKPLGKSIVSYHKKLFNTYKLRSLVDKFAGSVFEDLPKVFPSEDTLMQDSILKKVEEDESDNQQEGDDQEDDQENDQDNKPAGKQVKSINRNILKLLSTEKKLRLDFQKNTYTQRTA